jgi:hypothetical protein
MGLTSKTAEMKTLLLSSLIVLTIACSKPGTTAPIDDAAPVVKIIAPVVSEYYKTGDPLCFKGNVLASKQLEIVRLKLYSQADGASPCMEFEYRTSERSFELEKKIIVPSSLSGNCSIQFEAVDINGNVSKAVLGFSSN